MSRILVVDDDRAVCNVLQALLQQEGYHVVAAASGHAGVEAVENEPFDVIIVDMLMPQMDGVATIKAVRRHAPAVPIIAMSGFTFRDSSAASPDLLTAAAGSGAVRSLRKPFRPADLLKAIKECLEGKPGPGVGSGKRPQQ